MRLFRGPLAATLLAITLFAFGDARATDHEPDALPPDPLENAEPPDSFQLPTFEIIEGFALDFSVGSAWQDVSKVSQGTVILPNVQAPLVRSDGRILSTRLSGGLSYDWGEACCADNLRTSFSFDTTWGDETISRSNQPGNDDVAITYFAPAPSTSTGVNLGLTGLFGRQRIKAKTHDLRLTTHWDFEVCDAADVTVSPKLSLIYAGREQLALGQSTSLADPTINSRSEQRVKDHYFGTGFGLSTRFQLTPEIGLFGSAGIELYYHKSKLRSIQWNECGNPGCLPQDAQFNINIENTFDGFAWGSRLDVGATWSWDRLELSGSLGLDYLSDRGDLVNPTSPPAANYSFLVSQNAIEPHFNFGMTYRF